MKRHVFISGLFVIALMSVGVIALQAQKKVKFVYPKTTFNKAATQQALGKGKATIRGTAYTKAFATQTGLSGIDPAVEKEAGKKMGSKKFADKGTVVTLFPLTPYFEEYMKMRAKRGASIDKLNPFGKKKVPAVSEEAYAFKVTTTVIDDNGNFEFKNLKPGRYLVEAMVNYTKNGTAQRRVGSQTITSIIGAIPGIGGGPNIPVFGTSDIPIYESYSVSWNEEDYVDEEVLVTANGSVFTVNLR